MKISRTIKRFLFFSLMISVFTMGGCGKIDTNPDLLFTQIQEDVTELTGHDVSWNNSLEECDFSDCIINILEKGLNPDLAVYIALFNNRNLQAIYENLGIAKAQLVQAGLLKNPIFAFSYRFSTKSAITDLIDMSLFQNFLDIILIPLKKKVAQAELEAKLRANEQLLVQEAYWLRKYELCLLQQLLLMGQVLTRYTPKCE